LLFTIFVFLVVLGILVLVHEFGHFAAAKLIGVRVEKFSLGFWPKLFGVKWGETEYMVSLIPWGGYVKIAGQEEPEGDEPQPYELCSRPKRQRLLVYCAGPVMNLVLALLLFPVVYMMGVTVPAHWDQPALIGYVEQGSPAFNAGIKPGDVIVEVAGEPTENWERARRLIAMHPGETITVEVERSGRRRSFSLKTRQEGRFGVGAIGVAPPVPPIVSGLRPGYPAAKAGLLQGDTVVSINGEKIGDWMAIRDAVRGSGGRPLLFEVKRGGRLVRFEVLPRYEPRLGSYVIGITMPPYPEVVRKYPLPNAILAGLSEAWQTTAQTITLLGRLVAGRASVRSLGGPIMIAVVSKRAALAGIPKLVELIAFLGIQLFILNLLPIPILDGGHVLFLAIEAAIKRPLSPQFKEVTSRIWFVIIIAFMVMVSFNDILRLVE